MHNWTGTSLLYTIDYMYIEQDKETWEFMLINWTRQIRLSFEQTSWILQDFYDLDFDFDRANKFYNVCR